MIERVIMNDRPATVAYLKADCSPAERESAELVKVIFDDGEMVFLVPPEQTQKYNPNHDELGRFASGDDGGGEGGSPTAASWAKQGEDAGLTSVFSGESPIIYHGLKPGYEAKGYLFVTRSKEGAAFHGKVTAYRIKQGARVYADIETDMKHTGKQTLLDAKESNSSGIIHFNDLVPA